MQAGFGGPGALAGFGFSSMNQAFSSNRLGGAMAGAGGMALAGGIGIGGVLGGAGVAVGAFAMALGVAMEKLRQWSDALLEGAYRFAQFSASMAMVQARQQIQEAVLGRQRGDALAPSARRLMEARMQFERSTTPIENLWEKVKMEFTSNLLTAASKIVNSLNKVLEFLGILADDSAKREDNAAMNDFLRGLGINNVQIPANAGRPPRFGGGGGMGTSGGDF